MKTQDDDEDVSYVLQKFIAKRRAELLESAHLLPASAAHPRSLGQPRRAKILSQEQLDLALKYVARGNSPASDELKLLLSFYAGLRVAEIASLTMDAVTDAEGRIASSIWIPRSRSKSKHERFIPMHPKIKTSLQRFRRLHPDLDFIAFSSRYGSVRRQSANACTVWFGDLYRTLGFKGCSSHSGRRTFITRLTRLAGSKGVPLTELQRIAGHSSLDTTAGYIEPSGDVAALVSALGTSPDRALDRR